MRTRGQSGLVAKHLPGLHDQKSHGRPKLFSKLRLEAVDNLRVWFDREDPNDAVATHFDLNTVTDRDIEEGRAYITARSRAKLDEEFPNTDTLTVWRGGRWRENEPVAVSLQRTTAETFSDIRGEPVREWTIHKDDVLYYGDAFPETTIGYVEKELGVWPETLTRVAKHLPGLHDQKSHGRRNPRLKRRRSTPHQPTPLDISDPATLHDHGGRYGYRWVPQAQVDQLLSTGELAPSWESDALQRKITNVTPKPARNYAAVPGNDYLLRIDMQGLGLAGPGQILDTIPMSAIQMAKIPESYKRDALTVQAMSKSAQQPLFATGVAKGKARDGDGDGFVDDGKPTMRPVSQLDVITAGGRGNQRTKVIRELEGNCVPRVFFDLGISADDIRKRLADTGWQEDKVGPSMADAIFAMEDLTGLKYGKILNGVTSSDPRVHKGLWMMFVGRRHVYGLSNGKALGMMAGWSQEPAIAVPFTEEGRTALAKRLAPASKMEQALRDLYLAGYRSVAAVSKAEVDQNEVLDLAAEYARQHAGDMISDVKNTRVIQSIITRAIDEGWGQKKIEEAIARTVGLDARSQTALNNYEKTLIANGTPPGRRKRMVDAYSKKLKKSRVTTIANNERAMAIAEGKRQAWREMRSRGEISPYAVRIWRTHKDERTCEVCGPLNGRRASIDDQRGYQTIKGFSPGPPAHVNCRCHEELVDRGTPEVP